jgi:hypothetical protein
MGYWLLHFLMYLFVITVELIIKVLYSDHVAVATRMHFPTSAGIRHERVPAFFIGPAKVRLVSFASLNGSCT